MTDTLTLKMTTGMFSQNKIRMLVYGPSGVGKTRFASTWPKPIFMDADDGLSSVDLEVGQLKIRTSDDLYAALEYLQADGGKFETVILDTANEIQEIMLADLVPNFPSVKRAYNSMPGMSDYGKMLYDFHHLLKGFRDLDKHLVVVAQVAPKEYSTDIVGPSFIGAKTANKVTRMVDIIGRMYKAEDLQVCMGFSESEYVAKDRSGKLPDVVISPSFAALYKIWRG